MLTSDLGLSAWSAFCDLSLALYPAFLFWNVQVFSLWRKLGISVLFGLGVMYVSEPTWQTSNRGI